MTGLVPVTMKPSFIGLKGIRHYRFKEGLSLLEIATEIGGDLVPEFWTGHGVICVGDRRVPREWWPYVRPRVREGREIAVTFNIAPFGSQRTTGILVTLAGVAITAAGIYFQQGWLVSLGLGITASGVSMLLAPPPPQNKDRGSETKSIQAGIAGNAAAPFEWLPRVLGRMVYSPIQLIRAHSDYSRNVVTIKGAVGLVGHHEVTAVRVNGALADSMENFTYEVKEGAPGDTALTIGNDWVWEESPKMKLIGFDLSTDSGHEDELFDQVTPANSTPKFQTFLTRSGVPAKVVIRLLFPQGLSYDGGEDTEGAIAFRVEFRPRGSSTWILGPEFHFWDNNSGNSEIRQNIEFIWDTSTDLAGSSSRYVGYVAFFRAMPGHSAEYEADSYFSNGASDYCYRCSQDDDGFYVYLDPSTFPPGAYEFRIKRGLTYRKGRFTPSSYEYNPGGGGSVALANFFGYDPSGTKTVAFNQVKFRGDVQVEAFQTWVDGYPLQAALDDGVPLTLIGFEARNMEVQSIAATFESVVNTWNGTDWDTLEASRNPAALYRHVLIDLLNTDPRDPSIVGGEVLEAWYDRCVDNDYLCDAIVSDNEPEVLAMTASAGWAGPRNHEQWEVVEEYDRSGEPITQNFTPLNSSNYHASKPFADLPHAFNVEYADQDDDNALKTVIVYMDGYNADGSAGEEEATRFETIRMDGITEEAKVEARALGMLRALHHRQTERQIDVGIEVLCSQRGDVVGLSHDLRDEFVWPGIVSEVLTSGPDVIGLVLNASVGLSAATGPFSVVLRYMDKSVVTKEIVETVDTNILTFTTPFTIPAGNVLRKDCLVSVGIASDSVRRQLISNILYKDELTATVSLMDVAPQIWGHGQATDLLALYGGVGLAIVAGDDSMRIGGPTGPAGASAFLATHGGIGMAIVAADDDMAIAE